MSRFAIQNIESKMSYRETKYENSNPNAFVLATNFESPLPFVLTASVPQDVIFDNVLNSNNFFNPGELLPQISGNYLVNWSFNCTLIEGNPNQIYTATIEALNSESFNFTPSLLSVKHYNFSTIISSAGFSVLLGDDNSITFSITSPENSTIHLTSNIVNVNYVSKLLPVG